MMRTGKVLCLLMVAALVIAGAASVQADEGKKAYMAELKGIDGSKASGKVVFKLSDDGATLHYKLTASGIENLTMSHIHLAPPGKDGPAAVWLYPSGPPPAMKEGMFEGTLAEGDIKAEAFMGELKGKPMSALIEKFEAGEAYANIHTKAKPGGEVRGQIMKKMKKMK